jgi:hypothetical protein
MAWSQGAAPSRGLILDGALLPPIPGAAGKPLAFPVLDIANGLPAGRAAVAGGVAWRAHGVLMAARPIA